MRRWNDFENVSGESQKKEKYLSCHDLENGLIFFSDGVKHCCGLNKLGKEQKMIGYKQNMHLTIEEVIRQKEKIIEDNKCGKQTMCTSCDRLKEGYWNVDKKVRQINFSLDYVCNLKCQYCEKWGNDYTDKDQRDISEMMSELEECDLVDISFPILYSSGELSILKNRKRLLDSMQNYDICIFSNATKYQDEIMEKLLNSSSCIVISLDCGTRETYKIIKGVDLFETVCKNINRYCENGAKVVLKYIVMKNNISKNDFEGFFNICAQNNIKDIIISKDFYQIESFQNLKKASLSLMSGAVRRKMNIYVDGVYDVFDKIYGMKF